MLCRLLTGMIFLLVLAPSLSAADTKATQGKRPQDSSQLTLAMKNLEKGSLARSPEEKMYVVQDRPVVLQRRFDVSLGMASNLNSDIYVSSYEYHLAGRYYFTNRWFGAGYASRAYNRLTDSGERIWKTEDVYPNTSFVKGRYDAVFGYNLIYGKARLSRDSMFYFDQYVALGGGMVQQSNGIEDLSRPSIVGDIGISLWFGKSTALRFGVRDVYFEEVRRSDASRVHHVLGYATAGYLLGSAG